MWWTHISHSVADSQVRETKATKSPVSYGKKVVDPPEREILNVADAHFSQCDGPTCEGE